MRSWPRADPVAAGLSDGRDRLDLAPTCARTKAGRAQFLFKAEFRAQEVLHAFSTRQSEPQWPPFTLNLNCEVEEGTAKTFQGDELGDEQNCGCV